MMEADHYDDVLFAAFIEPIRKCASYVPAFGQGRSEGLDYPAFQVLYGGDPFYAWLGLNDASVYAAHKAAGGLTSVYRQIGVGAERLFRAVISQELGLRGDELNWSYEYQKPDGKQGVHTLDARISRENLDGDKLSRFTEWLETSKALVAQPSGGMAQLEGAVFEVRQGYKSADSKRQNADLRYGVRAYQAGLFPVFAIMSSQVSEPVMKRYQSDGMLVLTGVLADDPAVSTFAFFDQVVGFDLVAFFERNKARLKSEVTTIMAKLLSAS